MGQYKLELLSGEGRGDGGRRVWQKNELLSRTLNVRISVFKNNVAKIACKLQGERMGQCDAPKSELPLAVP
jgi:hypothetical protein